MRRCMPGRRTGAAPAVSVAGAIMPCMTEPMRRRVYGADHDDPERYEQPGRDYAELVGGPLDGLLLDVTGRPPESLTTGAALTTEIGMHGPGGRAEYQPRPGDTGRWDWVGDTP
ncbi:hypothetical protein K373_00981 [Streptomyces sp. DvalAA-21]|nr:hypothetical protein SACTE_0208 [Streptomyces sp. SirexAA-E]PZX42492.1 hypothetical protein K373_00981 [Streptomyces sp. DvalAA-21]RAJ39477.1 hypothetical protein K351_01119 [Streptomyces sp. DpondAA-E10]RAJ53438.1 hypothetical protein K352_00515 [Streptomyces sp. DpondAA-A50]SCD46354.1 hypothetical protein GA0115239_102136 [Streptomyces sp. BpilaLS-43]SCE30514.1 hypothetical protein GA0115235_1165127 [Streptomyces sp. DpondAA-F4a]SCM10585.1 hypothetical protein SAMN04883147_1077127 [Strep